MPDTPQKIAETSKPCPRCTSSSSDSSTLSLDASPEHLLTPNPNLSLSEHIGLLLRSPDSRRFTTSTSSNTSIVAAEISPLRFPLLITSSFLTSSSSATNISTTSSTDSSESPERRPILYIDTERQQNTNRNTQLSNRSALQSLIEITNKHKSDQKRNVKHSAENSSMPSPSTNGTQLPGLRFDPESDVLDRAYRLLDGLKEDLEYPSYDETPGRLPVSVRKPFVDPRFSKRKQSEKEKQAEPSELEQSKLEAGSTEYLRYEIETEHSKSDPFEMGAASVQNEMEARSPEAAQCEMEADPTDSEECDMEVKSSEPEQCVTGEATSWASEQCETRKVESPESDTEFLKSEQSDGESSKSEQSHGESLKPKQCKNEGSPKDSKAAVPTPSSNYIDQIVCDFFNHLRIIHELNEGLPSIDLTFESFLNTVRAIRSHIEFFVWFLINECGRPKLKKKNFESFRFAYNVFREEEYPKVLELLHLSHFVLTETETCELFEKQDDNTDLISRLDFAYILMRAYQIHNTKLQETARKIGDLQTTVASIQEWTVHDSDT